MNIGEVIARLLPDTQAHSSGPDHPFGGCRERTDLTPGGQLDLSALTRERVVGVIQVSMQKDFLVLGPFVQPTKHTSA